MQYLILALALVSVPYVQHTLENPTSFNPLFSGERSLILDYCQTEIPVVYSIYPGPSLSTEKTVTSCVPKKGDWILHIICAGEYTCILNESQTPAVELSKLIKEWRITKKRP